LELLVGRLVKVGVKQLQAEELMIPEVSYFMIMLESSKKNSRCFSWQKM
jgi:hypothetical protein